MAIAFTKPIVILKAPVDLEIFSSLRIDALL